MRYQSPHLNEKENTIPSPTGGPTLAEAKQQIPELERRLKLCPSNIEIQHHLGVLYFQSGRPEDALPLFEAVYNADRTQSAYATNLANCLKDMGMMERVEELSRAGYEKDQTQWTLQLAYAESLLRNGKYHKAWPIYERGRFTRIQTQLMMNISETVPEWKGQRIDGPLLVLGEGGFGDRINYSRFLPWINDRGVQYSCLIDAGCTPGTTVLTDLFNRLPWVDRRGEPKAGEPQRQVSFGHWITTFSLMAAFDIGPDEIPSPAHWYADPERVAKLQSFRSPDSRPTVGLVWAAGEVFEMDRKVRSMMEWQAGYLVAQTEDNIHWVNLQYNFQCPNAVNPPLISWEDTAAAIEICDGVISVDSGPLHLAQALGKPTWCVLSAASDWKFGISGPCPWYREMRIFRNGPGRGYHNSLRELSAALRNGEANEFKIKKEIEVSSLS